MEHLSRSGKGRYWPTGKLTLEIVLNGTTKAIFTTNWADKVGTLPPSTKVLQGQTGCSSTYTKELPVANLIKPQRA